MRNFISENDIEQAILDNMKLAITDQINNMNIKKSHQMARLIIPAPDER